MSANETVHALFELLIGLAWADQEVTPEEMDLLKDIIFRTPSITEHDWAGFDIYWITPIGEPELKRLAQRFLGSLRNEAGKQTAKSIVRELASADGQISPQEAMLLREIDKGIDRAQPTLLPDLSHLLAEALPKRSNAILGQDFQQRQALTKLKQRYGDRVAAQMGLYEDELRKLSLAGALMGYVAYADHQLDQEEVKAMQTLLERGWSLDAEHAAIVLHFALDAAENHLEFYRLVREFFELTTYQERQDFVDVLFNIALAHQPLSEAEMSAVEQVAQALKIHVEDFRTAQQQALKKMR